MLGICSVQAQSPAAANRASLLKYFYAISGKKTLSGIHNREPNAQPDKWTEEIHKTTGKYPGLWSGDFLFQEENITHRPKMIEEAARQWRQGSVVNIMWHACNPALLEPCGWDGQGVKSKLTDEQWQQLLTDGSELNKRWKQRVDSVARYLTILRDQGVAILWRPMHEMNQGVFWWGGRRGPQGTRRLWQIMHDYLTKEKGLDNLVWVWDIQDFKTLATDAEDYNPGSEYWDIAALDVYDDRTGYTKEKYEIMVKASRGKPIAIGECQKYPTAQTLLQQPRWTFFMGWSELVFSANTTEEIKAVIDAPNVLTRDEMPVPNSYSVSGWWTPSSGPFSPVVSKDGDILFRIHARTAQKVNLLFGEWDVKPQAMQHDTGDVWSVRLNNITPGIYSYQYEVDGIRQLDPHNPVVKAGTELYGSIVDVPGQRFDELKHVPHSSLQIIRYESSSLHKARRLYVCLPPHYNPSHSYPVLYLRHGGGDNESSWTQESGAADIIMENLVAEKRAVPMIIVMTNGLTDGSWAGGSTKEGMNALEQELIDDIIPLVDKNFHTLSNAAGRAIAGLSMGGGQAYIIGLKNPDKFAWVGEFSSGLLSDAQFDIAERVPGGYAHASTLRLLFIGCGKDDPRYPGHMALDRQLTEKGIRHESYVVPGGHEWKVWREELAAFMTKLFK